MGELSETDFFRAMASKKVLEKLAASYPSPFEDWFNREVIGIFKQHHALDHFSSRALSLIVNQVTFVLLTYSLLQ